MNRRVFLRGAAAGSAVVSMPAFLHGCAGVQPATVADPLPEDPFLGWFGVDRALLGRVMQALTAGGADDAELYFQHRRQSRLTLEDGAVGGARTDIVQGAGLRVVRGTAVGFAPTEDLTSAGLMAAAGTAASAARHDASSELPGFTAVPPGQLYLTDLPWSEVGIDRKLPVLERIDSLARAADPAVSGVTVSWSDTEERVLIATLDGRLIADHRPMTRLSVQVTMTRAGLSHSGFANVAARADLGWYTDERIERLVGRALARTELLFDARRPPSGRLPVILTSRTGGVLLHEAVGHALEADFVHDGTSPYGGALNTPIAPPAVTLVDEGTLPNERGALNYDDEGTPCGRNVLVEGGTLRSYLHDRASARLFGAATTASGRRESYRHAPMPRMSCTYMEDGPYERDELVAAMGRGLIAETFVGGNVSLGSGDFRFNVKHGWLVEKGKVLMPVRDFVLAGNGPEAFSEIEMVANDAGLDRGGWSCGKKGQTVPVSQGMPSVLVPGLGVEALS